MRPLVVTFSPRRDRLRPTPAAPAGPTTQLKSASVVSLSWRVVTTCIHMHCPHQMRICNSPAIPALESVTSTASMHMVVGAQKQHKVRLFRLLKVTALRV